MSKWGKCFLTAFEVKLCGVHTWAFVKIADDARLSIMGVDSPRKVVPYKFLPSKPRKKANSYSDKPGDK